MSEGKFWRCDRCSKDTKDMSGWYHAKIDGDNIFPNEGDFCSEECLKLWFVSLSRPWNT